MIALLVAAMSLGTQTGGIRPPAWQQDIGRRFAKAVKGESPFEDSDFVKPFVEGDRSALAVLKKCRLDGMFTPFLPAGNGKVQALTDQMIVEFACKTKRRDGSVGVTFHFTGKQVSQVETHNFDWIVSK